MFGDACRYLILQLKTSVICFAGTKRVSEMKIVFVLFLAFGLVNSESDEESPGNDGGPMPDAYMAVRIIEGPDDKTVGDMTKRADVPVKDQRCRWSVHELHNEGSILLCQCLKCVCTKTRWLCDYHFKQCPFFHCGQKIFSPITQKCCCGDIYAIKQNWRCCGYRYFDTKAQKCCAYGTLLGKDKTCPRSSV
ncbi:uncharacterized protein LOC114527591 isoform X2 [Dendronephthya gigantea]|uniref:uncharacterized protein LOC114527591 isoform X2 n=2 Tax=Dendronephthya gigantea TaxID=151771 RepID=UPI00106D52D5|nr:uncharacterized protein LOC114527591 isoform X2 [Dendronephthya gigantea]